MDLPITVMRHKTFEGGNTSPFYCSVKGRETRRSLLGIFHVVGDSFHPTGTWSSHNKKWRSFRCRSGGYIIFLCLSPSLSSVNSEDWQLLVSLRKILQVAFCRSSGFFSVETADALPVAHAASWSSCDRILREKAQIIRGSGHRNRPWKLLPDNVRDVDFVWLASFPKTIVNACKQMFFHLLFQSCRDRIQYRDRHTFIKVHQISINASFFSACHSSQLYSFCEVRGATHFGLPSSLGSPGRAKKPGGVLGTVTQDSSSGQCAAASFFFNKVVL